MLVDERLPGRPAKRLRTQHNYNEHNYNEHNYNEHNYNEQQQHLNNYNHNQQQHNNHQPAVDFVAALSDELVLAVFAYLGVADLLRLASVATHWRRMAFDRSLWRSLFLSRFSRRPSLRPSPSSPSSPSSSRSSRSAQHLRSHPQSHPQSHLQSPRRSSRAPAPGRHEHAWLRLYRIHHNWEAGQFHVTTIQPPMRSLDCLDCLESPRDGHVVAFAGSRIFMPDTASQTHAPAHAIAVRNAETGASEPCIPLPVPDPSAPSVSWSPSDAITLIKVFQPQQSETLLLAGMASGSWALYRVNSSTDAASGYLPRMVAKHTAQSSISPPSGAQAIVAAAAVDQVVCTCSMSFQVSLFSWRATGSGLAPRIIGNLTSTLCWLPVDLHLQTHPMLASTVAPGNAFQLTIACASPIVGGGWEPFVQQVRFSHSSILSSSHYFPVPSSPDLHPLPQSRRARPMRHPSRSRLRSHSPLPSISRPNHRHNSQPGAWHSLVDYSDSDDSVNDDDNDDGADSDPRCAHGKPVRPATSPSTFWNPFTNTMESIVHSYAPVTAIAVSLPFVICAHKDNSIQVYTLAPTMASRCGACSLSPGQVLELSHVKTIHGHAAHVTAVAIVCGRLLTGAADGIKVWDFPSVNGTRLVYSMPFADSIPLFVQQCMSPEPSAARPGAAVSSPGAVMASVASHLHMSLAASRATLLAIPDAPMVTIATSGSEGDIDIDVDSDGDMCPPVPVWLGFDLTRVVVLSLRQTPSFPAPTVQVLSFQ